MAENKESNPLHAPGRHSLSADVAQPDSAHSSDQSRYTLLGADGRPTLSDIPGTLGGNRRGKIYGRLDCPAALRAIARGGYARHRVFFLDELTALQAGFRPCAVCLPEKYAHWKAVKKDLEKQP